MVSFGLIEEWEPAPGRLVSWHASPESVARAARAPAHPAPPSHQQEAYLRLADRHAEADFRYSGLCVVTAEVPDRLDRAAMTRAITAFLLRHDTFRTWFALESGGTVQRHLVPPEAVEFTPVEHGEADNAEALRQHVQKTTPGPFQWDCFTFGAIEHEASTTVYLAVDHLHTDGVAQYLSCFDLAHLYGREMGWDDIPELPAPASYLDYCTRERKYSAALTPATPAVRKWLELLRGNDGDLPSFPLDLGKQTDGYNRSAHLTVPLFDEDAAQRFEHLCQENGAEFPGGIFAAAALAERELTGSDYYFGMTPISTRTSVAEIASVGWYVTLVPIAFPVSATATLARTLAGAQRAYTNGLRLLTVSHHRILELAPEAGIDLSPDWSTPMISYVDARDFDGNEFFDIARGGIYANRAATEEVLMWINRFPSGTSLSVIFPDTPIAHESVNRYVAKLKSVFLDSIGA
ncbi:condensation domain-containing protein [Nocardia sp. XZ_19_385]|uniref:condensation domain-containing protein n=1 Tax=Nocardia sp. XZ_19_385 TaxID=2769488 RepID=UPI00188E90FD|nr:condensation domain-containing protein [Nocardia sp. XZ_19_385]